MSNIPINLNRLAIEITNKCNFKCTMCIKQTNAQYKSAIKTHPGTMDYELFVKIINEYKELPNNTLGSVILQFQGEPLVTKNIFQYLDYVEAMGINFGFTTNAQLLTPAITDKLITYIHFTSIAFSIDSIDEHTFNTIRVGADMKLIFENIKYYLSKSSVSPNINTVQMGAESAEVDAVVKYWMSYDNIQRCKASIVTDENSVPIQFNYELEQQPCHSPFSNMIILTNGKAVACCRDTVYDIELGNVADTSLADVWYGARYQYLRKIHSTNNWAHFYPCNNCASWAAAYAPVINEVREPFNDTHDIIRRTYYFWTTWYKEAKV